jgi:glycosyltransferase involved in cell wall biosynthesis
MITKKSLAILIPANNEEDYIGACLDSLLRQVDCPSMTVVVSANACQDRTVAIVHAMKPDFEREGHRLICLDSPEGGKLKALDRAEAEIGSDDARLYLDADITCDPELVGQITRVLETDAPCYATGTLNIKQARTAFTRAYARFWRSLPFVQGGAVGVGCFAVNGAGRARWDRFPDIISDDTFVRLNFAPGERIEVPAAYHWPMIEGFRALVRVRRRQDAGVNELMQLYPHLMDNEGKASLTKAGLIARAFRMPVAFLAYMAVHIAVRMKSGGTEWSRGR